VLFAAALGELVADKHPKAPPRTSAPGIGSRLAAGAGVGFVLALR